MRNRPTVGRKKAVFSEEHNMKAAVCDVIEHQRAVRSVAKEYGIDRTTLGRYVRDARSTVNPEERCYKK